AAGSPEPIAASQSDCVCSMVEPCSRCCNGLASNQAADRTRTSAVGCGYVWCHRCSSDDARAGKGKGGGILKNCCWLPAKKLRQNLGKESARCPRSAGKRVQASVIRANDWRTDESRMSERRFLLFRSKPSLYHPCRSHSGHNRYRTGTRAPPE